jgi:hypothetical protein
MHQPPVCHKKVHGYMGPNVHHMNHVHMVNQVNEEIESAAQQQDRSDHLMASWVFRESVRSARVMMPLGSSQTIDITVTDMVQNTSVLFVAEKP